MVMSTLPVFALASQQAKWLSVRQAAIANNIANISTPGYRATDVKPFDQVLEATIPGLQVTDARHFSSESQDLLTASNEMTTSGSTVNIETEVMKASEVRRDFELNTAIVKAFHRMIMATTKG